MSKKETKYLYGWTLYVNYGNGWEYETFEEGLKNYKENKRMYKENCIYPQKWTKGRILRHEN